MNRRTLLEATIYELFVPNPIKVLATQHTTSNLSEHCFEIEPGKTIGIEERNITPAQFLRQHRNVDAAINGVYFGDSRPSEYRPEGMAYLARDRHFGTHNQKQIRGYFAVSLDGRNIRVIETLDGQLTDYWVVIGTHPLLVVDGKIHQQAMEDRYRFDQNGRERKDYRSAIGTKSGRNICFAVSEDQITMEEWGERLQKKGYLGAINLDGGPVSQLAERNNIGTETKGKGRSSTRLVIFEYRR